mmetsp:Transcript_25918/g.59884  ORF Transcript_25918/g.59884 Transcript_25918/m.59884 type:complete len:310 (-) Transcript_25918:117-1046(-)
MGRIGCLAAAATLAAACPAGAKATGEAFLHLSSQNNEIRARATGMPTAMLRTSDAAPDSQVGSSSNRAVAAIVAAAFAGVGIRCHGCRDSSRVIVAARKGKGGKRGGGGSESGGAQETGEGPEVDTQSLMEEAESKMGSSLNVLEEALRGIRAGKATPALIADVTVDAYGSEITLKEVATITATDNRTLLVNCFDETTAPAVEKGLMASSLGFGISPSGATIKVSIPELTTDKRKQYVKVAKEAAEKSRVAVRNVRQQAMKKIKAFEKKKDISEDTSKSLQADVESMVKKTIGEIDKTTKSKEEEILKV